MVRYGGMGIAAITNTLTNTIRGEGKLLKLAKGEVIQSSDTGRNLLLVKRGYVKRYLILNDGTIRVQLIYGPKDIFPLTLAYKALLEQELYTGPEVYYYEVMCDSEIYTLDKDILVDKVKHNDRLYSDLFSEAGRRLYFNIQHLENIGLPSSYNRVAHQLLFLARVFGLEQSAGTKIKVPLTQQDIADMLSITRERVSFCITQLREKDIIKPGRAIVIRDMKKLETEAFDSQPS
jgi:CRP/FNR family cyclic AMP-dependent transcriptional regulator